MITKNITFIGLNYAPEDTAIGLYSTQWVKYLSEHGFNVTVVTAFPYYPQWRILENYKNKPKFIKEEHDGITVLRYKQYVPRNPTFFKRILHLLDFTFGSIFNLYKVKKCDVVISVVPFTSSILLGYIQKKRFNSKLWVHIQDFEFDAALQTGVGNKKNLMFSMLFKIEKWLLSKSDIASTISQSMLEKLGQKTATPTFYLPNWIDETAINPKNARQHQFLISDRVKILYSGNIGDKQDWQTFLNFCNDVDQKKFEIILVGDGSKKEWVLQRIEQLHHVKYYPPVPYDQLPNLLCGANFHLLFQKPDVVDTVMPSKVLGMMASGRPSIIIGHPKSEVKRIFEESEGGLYFTSYSETLIDQLNHLADNENMYLNMGSKARDYVITHFAKAHILSKMVEQLKML